jgi:hypothetical protein
MASVVIKGDTSGQVTIAAPAVAGTNTATLPVATGELSMLGTTGQTWENVINSRSLATTYTNSTGKPIFVIVSAYSSSGAITITVVVNGVTIQSTPGSATNFSSWTSFIVPPSGTYSVSGNGTPVKNSWAELR